MAMEGGQASPLAERVLAELMPLRLAHKAVQLQWRIGFLPWTLFLMCTSALASLLVRFLDLAGIPPADQADKAKVRELTSVIEHMHQREDAYRRKLKELQEEGEVRLKDKKKALIKLQKARGELAALHAQLGEDAAAASPHASEADMQLPRPHPPRRHPSLSRAGLHLSVLAASLAALWLFRQENVPVISRKIVSSVVSPTWFFWGWMLFLKAPPAFSPSLFCASWFLLGYVACQRMASYSH